MELSIRHDRGFGIATLMPHTALASNLREALPQGWRRPRADQVPTRARLNPDYGALPGQRAEYCAGRQ